MEETAGLEAMVPDFANVSTQLIAVGGAVSGVIVTFVGIKWILSMIKGR